MTLFAALQGVMTLVLLAMVVVMMYALPWFMRQDVFFAVTVPADFASSGEGRSIQWRYQRTVMLHGFVVLLICAAVVLVWREPWRELAFVGGVLYLIAVSTIAFVRARDLTRPHAVAPSSVREASLTPRPPFARPAAFFGPFVLLGLAAMYLACVWPTLPAKIPMHYNIAGEVDRYADKSLLSVFLPVIIGTLVCLLFAGITWSMSHGLKRTRAIGPVAVRETAMSRVTLKFMLIVEYYLALLMCAIAVIITLPPEKTRSWMFLVPLAAAPALLIVLAVMINRVRHENVPVAERAPVGDGTPDECWKWGMIYYNPADPALWVEKRFGIGYTTNMARPAAWLLLGGIAAFILAVGLLAIFIK